jgi:hypothetical protein
MRRTTIHLLYFSRSPRAAARIMARCPGVVSEPGTRATLLARGEEDTSLGQDEVISIRE